MSPSSKYKQPSKELLNWLENNLPGVIPSLLPPVEQAQAPELQTIPLTEA